MPNTGPTAVEQRALHALAGTAIAFTAAHLLWGWAHAPTPAHDHISYWLFGVWALLLLASGTAAAVGSWLRSPIPGRRAAASIMCEFGGWGGSTFLVFWYSVIRYGHDHDRAMFGCLLVIVFLTGAMFARIYVAWRAARKQFGGS